MDSIESVISLPAFQSRNYRLFFLGQGLSLIGTWITMVAMIWLVNGVICVVVAIFFANNCPGSGKWSGYPIQN